MNNIYSKFHISHLSKYIKLKATSENRGYCLEEINSDIFKKFCLDKNHEVIHEGYAFAEVDIRIEMSDEELSIINNYLNRCKYGNLIMKKDMFYLEFRISNEVHEYNENLYHNNVCSHIWEILNEFRNPDKFKNVEVNKNKLNIINSLKITSGILLANFLRSKILKKLDLKINCAIKLFNELSSLDPMDVEKYIWFEKLSDILIAKSYSVDITGASDIIDAKKTVCKIIKAAANNEDCYMFIRSCIDACEKEFSLDYKDTILRRRIEKEIVKLSDFINFDDLSTGECFSAYFKLQSHSEDCLKKIKRIKNICKKVEFAGIINTLDKNFLDISSLENVDDKINAFIKFIDENTLRDFNGDCGKLICTIGNKIISEKLVE